MAEFNSFQHQNDPTVHNLCILKQREGERQREREAKRDRERERERQKERERGGERERECALIGCSVTIVGCVS